MRVDHQLNEVYGIDVEVQGQRVGLHSRTKPRGQDEKGAMACENHVRELRTFFTVVLEPNIHTFSVLSETLPDFLKSKLC